MCKDNDFDRIINDLGSIFVKTERNNGVKNVKTERNNGVNNVKTERNNGAENVKTEGNGGISVLLEALWYLTIAPLLLPLFGLLWGARLFHLRF